MRLVEVVAGDDTSPRRRSRRPPRSPGRWAATPIRAADAIGFVANRCARPFSLEALRLLGERHRRARPDRPHRADRRRLPDGPVRADGPGGRRRQPRGRQVLLGAELPRAALAAAPDPGADGRRRAPRPQGRARLLRLRRGPHRPDDPSRSSRDPWTRRRSVALDGDARARGVRVDLRRPSPHRPRRRIAPPWSRSRAGRDDAGRALDRGRALLHRASASTSSACPATRRASSSAGSSARSSTRRTSPSARASPRRRTCDTAMRLGFNSPRGPFEWGEAIGLERVRRDARRAARRAGRGALPGCAAAAREAARRARDGRAISGLARSRPRRATSRATISARPISFAAVIASLEEDRSVDDGEPGRDVGDDASPAPGRPSRSASRRSRTRCRSRPRPSAETAATGPSPGRRSTAAWRAPRAASMSALAAITAATTPIGGRRRAGA